MSTPTGASRALVRADGSKYNAVRWDGVIADEGGVTPCEVVVFTAEDGSRVGSMHLAPGAKMEALSDGDLLELLDEVRRS